MLRHNLGGRSPNLQQQNQKQDGLTRNPTDTLMSRAATGGTTPALRPTTLCYSERNKIGLSLPANLPSDLPGSASNSLHQEYLLLHPWPRSTLTYAQQPTKYAKFPQQMRGNRKLPPTYGRQLDGHAAASCQ